MLLAEDEFYEPISLGLTCETKYQISRVASARLYPSQSEMAFRYAIRQPDHGGSFFTWRLFDWQDTTLETICDYIERDFQGVFRLEDFAITYDHDVPATGGLINTAFQTVHVHEFPPLRDAPTVTLDQVAAQYDVARRMFDRLAADFRRLLTLPGPYLYVVSHPSYPQAAVLERLIGLLSSRSSEHRFHVLVVGRQGFDSDLSSLGEGVTKAWRSRGTGDKPDHLAWEGHDPSWDRALAPFRIGFHKRGFHDPGSPWSSDSAPADSEMEGAATHHPNFPSAGARIANDWAPEVVFSPPEWRSGGAELDFEEGAATLVSPAVAWHYSHAAKLDFGGLDVLRRRAWLKVVFAEVSGGPLLASLCQPAADDLAEETLVDRGAGPIELFLKIRDVRRNMLLLRTGASGESARARLLRIQLLVEG